MDKKGYDEPCAIWRRVRNFLDMLFTSIRGTKDILPPETGLWQAIEEDARAVFSSYAYEEIRTPIIEESKLFLRTLGDTTDIVSKQMFLIKRETDSFALRPEATASIARSYVEHGLYNVNSVSKFYYLGPMFRAERPQKGRLRQFHHIGAEAIGSDYPYLDAETISLADAILKEAGITGFEVALNTLGCLEDKKKFALGLREKLLPQAKSFCQDCQTRINKNIFRLLDCKNSRCREMVAGLTIGHAHICPDCLAHFEAVREGLSILGVDFKINPLLMRGLDYYTRTVFEITHSGLGAQDALGAGGRYDYLVEELGGPARGAVGFALGVERMLLCLEGLKSGLQGPGGIDCYVISLGVAAMKRSLGLVKEMRQAHLRADLDYLSGSLKSKLRRADRLAVRFCLIIGDNELVRQTGILKNMSDGTQEEVGLDQAIEKVKSEIRSTKSETNSNVSMF